MHSIIISNLINEMRFWGIASRANQDAAIQAVLGLGPIDSIQAVQAAIQAVCGVVRGLDSIDMQAFAQGALLWALEQGRSQGYIIQGLA